MQNLHQSALDYQGLRLVPIIEQQLDLMVQIVAQQWNLEHITATIT
jgi:hypothetical protein